MHYLIAGLIGIVTGIVSGLLGVGGGLIMVPAMTLLLSPPIRDIKQAIGTSLAVIIPTALIGVGNITATRMSTGASPPRSSRPPPLEHGLARISSP